MAHVDLIWATNTKYFAGEQIFIPSLNGLPYGYANAVKKYCNTTTSLGRKLSICKMDDVLMVDGTIESINLDFYKNIN